MSRSAHVRKKMDAFVGKHRGAAAAAIARKKCGVSSAALARLFLATRVTIGCGTNRAPANT